MTPSPWISSACCSAKARRACSGPSRLSARPPAPGGRPAMYQPPCIFHDGGLERAARPDMHEQQQLHLDEMQPLRLITTSAHASAGCRVPRGSPPAPAPCRTRPRSPASHPRPCRLRRGASPAAASPRAPGRRRPLRTCARPVSLGASAPPLRCCSGPQGELHDRGEDGARWLPCESSVHGRVWSVL
jgi:hypothetical protein